MKDELSKLGQSFVQHTAVQLAERAAEDDPVRARNAIDTALLRTRDRTPPLTPEAAEAALASSYARDRIEPRHIELCRSALAERAGQLGIEPGGLLDRARLGLLALADRVEQRAPVPTETYRRMAMSHVVSGAEQEEIDRLLAVWPPDTNGIARCLAANPGVAGLLREWGGTKEAFSIRRHGEMVSAQLVEQRPHHGLEQLRFPAGVRIDRVLAILPWMHDIGKPLSVEAERKSAQHEYTIPLMQKLMRDYRSIEAEIELATCLVDHDLIGGLRRPTNGITSAKRALEALSRRVGMDANDFFVLQLLFFVSDASAYPELRAHQFDRTPTGKLIPNEPRILELVSSFSNHGLAAGMTNKPVVG